MDVVGAVNPEPAKDVCCTGSWMDAPLDIHTLIIVIRSIVRGQRSRA